MKQINLYKSFKYLCIIILSVLITACNPTDKAIRQMCIDLHKQYPQANLQDIYKTCYQDCFGSAHLMSDTAAARYYLHQELESIRNVDLSAMPKEEFTGYRHRFTRINLACVLNSELTEEELFTKFIQAAAPANALELNWVEEWKRIEQIALQVNPNWADPKLQAFLRESAQANQTVMHSEPFRQAYHPHYRIVKN